MPVDHLNQLAAEQGFSRSSIKANGFNLLVYENRVSTDSQNNSELAAPSVLHVYLEGDGSPWRHRTIVMPDPTPRSPLMLRLMGLDQWNAAYLGRPCYNGSSQDQHCESSLWTSGRYSNTVIASMASGIRVLVRRFGTDEVWLFGHSGGGALAMLLAEQLPQVTRVVTVAGNLDTDAWTRHHGYTPLYSSRNPALQPLLRQDVLQWHLLGGLDTTIPPQLVRPFVMQQPEASGYLYNGFDHGCCWRVIWPSLLESLAADDPNRMPGQQFKFPDHSAISVESP